MRQDNGNLLNRIDQPTFRYLEFEDTAADADVWPMFEALLRDERVVGSREAYRRRIEFVGAMHANDHPTTIRASRGRIDIAVRDVGGAPVGIRLAPHGVEAPVEVSRPASQSETASQSSVKSLLERLTRPE